MSGIYGYVFWCIIMYYVLCIMYYVLCIMYYVLCIIISRIIIIIIIIHINTTNVLQHY